MRNVLVLAILVAAPVLSGCMGDDEPTNSSATDDDRKIGRGILGNLTGFTDNSTLVGNASDDHLPHVHDYWAGRDRVVLADETVDLEPWMVFNNVFRNRDPSLGGAYWVPPEGKTIYEGTGKLEITLDWADQTITSLAMSYRHAGTNEWTDFAPVEKGSPFVIDVTPEMVDLPHSGGSRWAFMFKPATTGAAVGAMKLKAEIVRVGDLHAFPAHIDFFGKKEEITLMDDDTRVESRAWTSHVVAFAQGTEVGDEGFTLPEGSIVPPGTKTMTVDVKPKDSAPVDNIYFSYRDAAGEWNGAESIESPEAGTYRFVIPVERGGVDSYYAKSTQWRFYVQIYFGGTTEFQCGGCTDRTTDIHAKVIAYKFDPFEEEEESSDEGEKKKGGGNATAPAVSRLASLVQSPARLSG